MLSILLAIISLPSSKKIKGVDVQYCKAVTFYNQNM